MRLLLLGGTLFLGRHIVEAARARGHEVSLFHRGKTHEDLFPEIEHIHGDRDGGLAILDGRRWDAAIDTCGYVPRIVRASAERLAGAVGRYVFVSTISVYGTITRPGVDESEPVATLADPSTEAVTGETYGPLKALCERAVEAACPGRALIVRPGLIVGPHDPSDRFTYWPHRLARGGDVLVPGPPECPVQFIDVRDLAAWIVRLIEEGATGLFNATGPERRLTFGGLAETCRAVVRPEAGLVWVDGAFLLEAGVAPWSDLPLWLSAGAEAMSEVDVRRAVSRGLTFRPLADTIRDTREWDACRPADRPLRAGLSPQRESEILAKWARSRPSL